MSSDFGWYRCPTCNTSTAAVDDSGEHPPCSNCRLDLVFEVAAEHSIEVMRTDATTTDRDPSDPVDPAAEPRSEPPATEPPAEPQTEPEGEPEAEPEGEPEAEPQAPAAQVSEAAKPDPNLKFPDREWQNSGVTATGDLTLNPAEPATKPPAEPETEPVRTGGAHQAT